MQPIFDSHAHLIAADLVRYPRNEAAGGLALTAYESADLLADMAGAGVSGALLVQRGQAHGFDNGYVCDSAMDAPGRLFAVCGINATEPDCGAKARAWHQRGAVGFRLMERARGQNLDWLCGEYAGQLWQAAADLDVPMCVHFFPWNREAGLEALDGILTQFPTVRLVIDHLSNAPIDGKECDGIDGALRPMIARGGVALKFTAIPLARLEREGIDAGVVLRRFIEVFGAERLMWGSDVTQSAGSYGEIVALGRRGVASLSAQEQNLLLNQNARQFYRLG